MMGLSELSMARIIAIHGWQGSPHRDWFPWLKKNLESKGHNVIVPEMPATQHPVIQPWVSTLTKITGKLDENTFLVGHSIGCQTILRFLAKMKTNEKVGGVILVAPWTKLKPTSYETPADKAIIQPWLEVPIPWEHAKVRAQKFVCFFSDDDPFVYVENSKVFKEKLGAEIIIEKNKGHYSEGEGIKEIPSVLKKIESIMKH